MQCKLLLSPWKNEFIDVISKTRRELVISSPFVNAGGVGILAGSIAAKSSVKVTLITNLSVQNILNEVTVPSALLELHRQFGHVEVSSVGRLHAKVYLRDDDAAIITSANLTSGGLLNNFEYGVLINEKGVVSAIKDDMSKYFSLGNVCDRDLLEKVENSAKELAKTRRKVNAAVTAPELTRLLRKGTDKLDVQLLENRVKGGKTIHAIFCDTILYVLEREGPLDTKTLEFFIQSILPDICNDSIYRVIHGENVGRKWKHQVRSSQSTLKDKGIIYLKNRKWYLASRPDA